MQLLILCAGKLRSAPLQALCAEYLARLGRYGPCELREVRAGTGTPAETLAAEGARFMAGLAPGDQVWVLDERGRQCTSRELAAQLGECEVRSVKRLVVILGGAYGLSDEVKRRGRLWSLSALTFPHELCRLILLEQLYRARTIMRGEPYHH